MREHRGSRHGRLPWPRPDQLGADARAVYDAIVTGPRTRDGSAFALTDADGRLEGPFNAMLVSPALGTAVQELGSAIRYRTTLPDRCREIAILTLARERDSAFEWYAHSRVGRRVGLGVVDLAALETGRPGPSFSPAEQCVHTATVALCRDRDLDDALHERLAAALGLEQLNELIVLVGYYDLLALSLRVWRTPLPDAASPTGDSGGTANALPERP